MWRAAGSGLGKEASRTRNCLVNALEGVFSEEEQDVAVCNTQSAKAYYDCLVALGVGVAAEDLDVTVEQARKDLIAVMNELHKVEAHFRLLRTSLAEQFAERQGN